MRSKVPFNKTLSHFEDHYLLDEDLDEDYTNFSAQGKLPNFKLDDQEDYYND